jgi:hypothetical protein
LSRPGDRVNKRPDSFGGNVQAAKKGDEMRKYKYPYWERAGLDRHCRQCGGSIKEGEWTLYFPVDALVYCKSCGRKHDNSPRHICNDPHWGQIMVAEDEERFKCALNDVRLLGDIVDKANARPADVYSLIRDKRIDIPTPYADNFPDLHMEVARLKDELSAVAAKIAATEGYKEWRLAKDERLRQEALKPKEPERAGDDYSHYGSHVPDDW